MIWSRVPKEERLARELLKLVEQLDKLTSKLTEGTRCADA